MDSEKGSGTSLSAFGRRSDLRRTLSASREGDLRSPKPFAGKSPPVAKVIKLKNPMNHVHRVLCFQQMLKACFYKADENKKPKRMRWFWLALKPSYNIGTFDPGYKKL